MLQKSYKIHYYIVLINAITILIVSSCQDNYKSDPKQVRYTPVNIIRETPEKTETELPSVIKESVASRILETPSTSVGLTTMKTPTPKETSTGISLASHVPLEGRLVFSLQRQDTNVNGKFDIEDDVHIYSLVLETGLLSQLTFGNHRNLHPSWSPDGERIAFVSNRSGNFELFTMNADGSDLRQLTDTPEDETTPEWSPDGTKIVFISVKTLDSGHQEKRLKIIVSSDDNVQVPTHISGNVSNPDWSPDGRYLLFEQVDEVENDGYVTRDTNYYFWDEPTDSLIMLDLNDSRFDDIYLLDPRWLPREGYFLSFNVQKKFADTPTDLAVVYEVEWIEDLPVLNEIFSILDASAPYEWGYNGEWLFALISNDSIEDGQYDLISVPIDYSAKPPMLDLYEIPSVGESIIDNIYYYSDFEWIP